MSSDGIATTPHKARALLARPTAHALAVPKGGFFSLAYVDHIRLFKDQAGEYRWTAVASNGEPVADSDEGYTDQAYARESITLVFGDRVRVVEEEA